MKQCCRCLEWKGEGQFNKSQARKDGLQHWCRYCQREATSKRYWDNRATLSQRASEQKIARREAMRVRVYDYLMAHPCIDCGETDPVVLEFDHVRGKKRFAISNYALRVVPSWDTLLGEIAKCEVRCANCHRRKTARQLNWRSPCLADKIYCLGRMLSVDTWLLLTSL